jgi:hypothetical protein
MNVKMLKFRIKIFIGNSYYGFKYITKRYGKRQFVIVNDNTDLMIEGFPRSGNTFAVAAFNFPQGGNLDIARHRHEAGHVALAVKLKKPVLIIVRNPIDAVISLCIREKIDVKYSLQYYINFHKKILQHSEHILFVDFKEAIVDMGKVIEKINIKFNTNFSVFVHNKENISKVGLIVTKMDRLEIKLFGDDVNEDPTRVTQIALPTKERDKIKHTIKNTILNDSSYSNLLLKAEDVYRICLNKNIEKIC